MTQINYHFCLNEILKWEGGNDDDPHDPGGRTSRGITQHEYDLWCDHHNQRRKDVWHASNEDVQAIYEAGYWLPKCPALADGLDLMYFNIGVNCGVKESETLFRRALSKERGTKVSPLIKVWADELRTFYRGLHHPYFQKGWINRADDVEKVALTMVKGESDGSVKGLENSGSGPGVSNRARGAPISRSG
jgi:Glycosyl hydrolase 108